MPSAGVLDSAFAMPSATSSANDASRVSAPAGNGRGFVVDIATAPHMRPSIITGAATAAWAPMRRTYSAVPVGGDVRVGVDAGRRARAVDALQRAVELEADAQAGRHALGARHAPVGDHAGPVRPARTARARRRWRRTASPSRASASRRSRPACAARRPRWPRGAARPAPRAGPVRRAAWPCLAAGRPARRPCSHTRALRVRDGGADRRIRPAHGPRAARWCARGRRRSAGSRTRRDQAVDERVVLGQGEARHAARAASADARTPRLAPCTWPWPWPVPRLA